MKVFLHTGQLSAEVREEGGHKGHVPPNFGLNVAYTTKFLESFHQWPYTGVRMHQIRFAGLCPGPCLWAHNFKITPVHYDLWTFDFQSLSCYDVNMFTKFYISSFTSFDVYSTMC